ncbi:hypothetical protein GCM10010299_38070 [Streptomyces tanashiensis]|nr:hypothetical protein GCM10010299_38070 [Streptomyces tanashiensis]
MGEAVPRVTAGVITTPLLPILYHGVFSRRPKGVSVRPWASLPVALVPTIDIERSLSR